jgi:hypothetical protein
MRQILKKAEKYGETTIWMETLNRFVVNASLLLLGLHQHLLMRIMKRKFQLEVDNVFQAPWFFTNIKEIGFFVRGTVFNALHTL